MNTYSELKEKSNYIADHYGKESQLNQCIEEMAELTQAIIKLKRVEGIGQPTQKNKEEIIKNVIEELSDVQITLWEIQKVLNISDENIKENILFKIDRQYERIKKEQQ